MRKPYRLSLDLGSTSLGWAIFHLNTAVEPTEPTAIVRAGVRIFGDGRNPKDGTSLAVTRRMARAMRRRRDRLLKRKARLLKLLVDFGFFPKTEGERKALANLDPYAIRAKGLDKALTPSEFGRALFHLSQRRGFKSNRKTDKADNDGSALKGAISRLRANLEEQHCRTVGEWLNKRFTDLSKKPEERTVRARFRQTRVTTEAGKPKIEKSYDLYIDRKMVEDEFDALWLKQAALNPKVFTEPARAALKDCLLFQRNLRPVKPGRCTLMPEEERAPLALLNYGYTVLRAATARAIVAAGLHPSIGLHHSNDTNAMRLVDDVMEPFRPTIDLKVWQLLRNGEKEVVPETKRALVRTLYDDMQSNSGVTPLSDCIQRLATSLAHVFLGEREELELPLPGLPLNMAADTLNE
jgi:hypothetical protein